MPKKFLLLTICILFTTCFAINIQIKKSNQLDKDTHYFICDSPEIHLIAHVITMPIDKIDIKLIPAAGQREEVLSIAKRNNAFVAINGSNYRRGGKYNGNRLNLFYLYKQIYTDLQFIRGSFGWNSKTKTAFIDKTFLKVDFFINKQPFPIDQINQPRVPGKSVFYTETADKFLLLHTPGKNIIIDNNGMIQNITTELPDNIPHDWYVYQIDENSLCSIQKNMKAEFSYKIQSSDNDNIYHAYDFILGGAGVLIQNGEIKTDKLYDEFSQGTEVVHCNDEVAADFHTRKMQEWLIEQRHPRTAIGITSNNKICIVVVDGRQNKSEGLSLPELACFMKKFYCISALNLGGGGCSTLCIDKKVMNNPSANEDRPVSEALCFFKS